MKFNWVRSLAVVIAVAVGPVGAFAAAPALTNILEELTTWTTVTPPEPTRVPGRPSSRLELSVQDFARDEIRHRLPRLWVAAGQPAEAERLAGSDPVEYKRAGDQAALAVALFAARRDADALRVLEAAPTDPLNHRAPTLMEAAIGRLKSGDGPGALGLMEKAIQWRDTNQIFQPAALLHWFAKAQIESHRSNEALASLTRAVQWTKSNQTSGDQAGLSFTLRDIAHSQAQLGRPTEAMATANLIPEIEQRLTARLFVVRSYVESGNADGAVAAVRASIKVDAPAFVRSPFALYAPAEAAVALAEAGRWEEAAAFLEESVAAIRSQPMDSTQAGEFQRSVAAARGLLVSQLLFKASGYLSLSPVDPTRLELIAKLAEKVGSEEGRKAVAEARENNRVRDNVRSGRLTDAASVDVSSPEGVRQVTRLAAILFDEGRGADAERILVRLKPEDSQPIYEAAARNAIARTNLTLARTLIPKLSSTNAPTEVATDASIHLSLALAHALASSGRTNEAIAVLTPAVNLARVESKTPSNRWVLAVEGGVLQADLGLFNEALSTLASGPAPMAIMGGPQVGRRMARQLGPEAAIDRVRKMGSTDAGKLVLLGIAQEMAKLGGD